MTKTKKEEDPTEVPEGKADQAGTGIGGTATAPTHGEKLAVESELLRNRLIEAIIENKSAHQKVEFLEQNFLQERNELWARWQRVNNRLASIRSGFAIENAYVAGGDDLASEWELDDL